MAGSTITMKGPFFSASAVRVLADYADQATRAVAEVGADDLRAATSVFRNPTGFYRSQVAFSRQGTRWVVDDGNVVYGPWLEGVSSRNARTRFKGYHLWRQTTQRLQAKAHGIAEGILPRFISRLR